MSVMNEILLLFAAIVATLLVIRLCTKSSQIDSNDVYEVHICKYNNNPHCCELACKYCHAIKECDHNCGGDCDKCAGHKVMYLKREDDNYQKSGDSETH